MAMADSPELIVDVMGAERGIHEVVKGATQACAELGSKEHRLVLVTAEPERTEQLLRQEQASLGLTECYPEVVDAPQLLPDRFTNPMDVYKKHPECSIRKAMDRAKGNPLSAVISPATTGLVMTSAIFTLGRAKGIDRTPIGTPMPTRGKLLFFVDGGSVVDCKPRWLYQFAILAHLYVQNLYGIEHPSIALLSNGTEEYKGTETIRRAYDLLARDENLNFTGYTEGHTMLSGDLDIMVCDGFIGNILLKAAEGIADTFSTLLRQELKRDPLAAMAAKLFQRGAFRRMKARTDYAQYGGAPLLGLNGNVIICHGRSPALAIKNAVLVGYELAASNIAQQVAQYMSEHSVNGNQDAH